MKRKLQAIEAQQEQEPCHSSPQDTRENRKPLQGALSSGQPGGTGRRRNTAKAPLCVTLCHCRQQKRLTGDNVSNAEASQPSRPTRSKEGRTRGSRKGNKLPRTSTTGNSTMKLPVGWPESVKAGTPLPAETGSPARHRAVLLQSLSKRDLVRASHLARHLPRS